MVSERALRSSRRALLAALVAVLAFAFLDWLPHAHAGAAPERSCAACQVARADGAAPPPVAPQAPGPAVATFRTAPDAEALSPLPPERGEDAPPRGPPAFPLS